MISRLLAITFVMWCFPVPHVHAVDYRIRLENVGYRDSADEKPRESVLNSLEIIARPDTTFYGRSVVGGEIFSLKGKLTVLEAGRIKLAITYASIRQDDRSAVTINGEKIPGRAVLSGSTEIELKLNVAVGLGGGLSSSQRTTVPPSPVLKSQQHLSIYISAFDPDAPLPDEAAATDRNLLFGQWNAVELTENGEAVEDSIVQQIDFKIYGNQLTLDGAEPRFGKRHFGCQLDASTTPKTMRLTSLEGPLKGHMINAIYEIQGDKLSLCMPFGESKASPQEFKSTPGSNLRVFRLKRFRPVGN